MAFLLLLIEIIEEAAETIIKLGLASNCRTAEIIVEAAGNLLTSIQRNWQSHQTKYQHPLTRAQAKAHIVQHPSLQASLMVRATRRRNLK